MIQGSAYLKVSGELNGCRWKNKPIVGRKYAMRVENKALN